MTTGQRIRTMLALTGMPKGTANWEELNGKRSMVLPAFMSINLLKLKGRPEFTGGKD